MNRRTTIIVGVAALALLVILGFLFFGGRPTPSPTPSPTEEPTPSPSPTLNAALLAERLTVFLAGVDINEQRQRQNLVQNTDALMLVSIGPDQRDLTLVSLPRDTVDIPLADGSAYPRKINALFAESGTEELVGAMEALYGVPIDAHVLLDMDDFTALIDAVGGVTVDPADPLVDPPIGLDLASGEQEIDAQTALSYVRTRVDQDYGRMGRQQEVILDLVRRLVAADAEVDLSDLANGLDSLETDLPLDQMPTLAEIARRIQDVTPTRILVEPPEMITFEGDAGDGRGYVLVPDVEAIRAAVTAEIPPDE